MVSTNFKWKHFAPTIILWCLRWYGSTPLSYAHVSDMLAERGISVHRSTIYRWFIQYAPVLRKKLKKYQFIRTVTSWQLDETYVKVNGKWFYLYRAIDKHGDTLDIYFSPKRNRHAAYEFLVDSPLSETVLIRIFQLLPVKLGRKIIQAFMCPVPVVILHPEPGHFFYLTQ